MISQIYFQLDPETQTYIVTEILWVYKGPKKKYTYSLEMNLNYTTVDISKELWQKLHTSDAQFLFFSSAVREREYSPHRC